MPNLKLCVPFCHDTFPMFSHRCSRRISGSDRELPKPPKPDGLMIGATGPSRGAPGGWYPGICVLPGISAKIGEVNGEGSRKLVNLLNPNLSSPTTCGGWFLLTEHTP